jgi:TPR repeat protein
MTSFEQLLFEELQARAEKGELQAQVELGIQLNNTLPQTRANLESAVGWFRRAAEQGLSEAQYHLGNAYLFGSGVENNSAAAVEWLQLAANQNHISAAIQLGFLFLRNEGIEKDISQSVKWFSKAADQGSPHAQYNLGNLFSEDCHGVRNDAESVRWFRKAADQGHAVAQYALGGMYAEGRGIPKDYSLAMAWFRKAAEQGYEGAIINLSRWPTASVTGPQDNLKVHCAQDLESLLKNYPDALRILCINRVHIGELQILLDVTAMLANGRAKTYHIFCLNAIEYSIRPKDPHTYLGGPCITFHERHSLLDAVHLQTIPGGDGEIFRPPLVLKLLILDQSHVIAESFELRSPLPPSL